MAIAFRCDPAQACTFVVWHGEVSLDQWLENLERILDDPTFPPGPSWLVDLQTASSDLFDDAALAAMGQRFSEHGDRLGGIRLAAVPNGSWDKARHLLEHEIEVRGFTSMQFATLDTACVWLGLQVGPAMAAIADLRNTARRTTDGP